MVMSFVDNIRLILNSQIHLHRAKNNEAENTHPYQLLNGMMLFLHSTFTFVKSFVNEKMCGMNSNSKLLSCEEANNLDMVDYFSKLGLEPKRISGHQYWYLSPFRNERTASFKINRNINCWYDFGEGKGGTMVDFGIRYFKCSVYEFLQQLFLSPAGTQNVQNSDPKNDEPESSIDIKEVKMLSSPSLRNYLKERKIDIDIAKAYCKEISFTMNDKNYFAIGFQNNSGGYELRNSFFKGSTNPKDMTLIQNQGTQVSFFEGFFDFLAYKTITEKTECVTEDYCILNSLSFLNKARQLHPQYRASRLFFDHDKAGIKATQELLQSSNSIVDESALYRTHKDLNEWLMKFGLSDDHSLKKSRKQSL